MKHILLALVLALFCFTTLYAAQYDEGANDKEIKIGNTAPYTGPVAAAQTVARVEQAYFNWINAAGGINGRKITFISLDDAYSPPKTVEQARALVENDSVLFVFNPIGTENNLATRQYFNRKKVPQIFVASGAEEFYKPKTYPWTTGLLTGYADEGRIYGAFILKNYPNAKIAVLYLNDSLGKAYLSGFKEGLGSKASNIVKEESYDITEANVDSQINNLKASGATIFFNAAVTKSAAQALQKMHEIGWHPIQFLDIIAANRDVVLKQVGYSNVQDIISIQIVKDPADPKYSNDPSMKEYLAFMKKEIPSEIPSNPYSLYGYFAAQTIVDVLKRCGNVLTRENVLKQATNFKFSSPILLPGIEINISPNDYWPFKFMQLVQFKGQQWVPLGSLVDVHKLNVPLFPKTTQAKP